MAYRTLATILYLAAAGSTSAGGAEQCQAGGHCGEEEAVSAPALLQTKKEREVLGEALQESEFLGERRMVKRWGQRILLQKTELVLKAGSMKPATANEKDEFLRVHNEFRCMHGSPPLTWSDAMATNASNYAGPLTDLIHSASYDLAAPEGPAGENLYWRSEPATPEMAVTSWYDEVQDCVGGPSNFNDGCLNGAGGNVTGHFTAMIWKGAKEMGCAWSDSGLIAICRYRAGDSLSYDTPNILPESNYVKNVPHMVKSRDACQAESGTAPAPSPMPTPAPPTPAPPAPPPAAGGACVTGSGEGGCTMTSSGCGKSQVDFSFHCSTGVIWTIGMPDNYSWNLIAHCPHCSNIVVH